MNVLVSGAGGNLGRAVVKKMIEKGHTIYALYGKDDEVPNDNQSILQIQADLTNSSEAAKVVGDLVEGGVSINAAVLTVGGFAMGTIEDTSIEDIHRMIALNFDTTYNLVKPLLQSMHKGGKIFLTTARPALDIKKGSALVSYALSKSLVKNLAGLINGSSAGVDCGLIVPSIIDTPQNREAMPDQDFSKWITPEQIASAVIDNLDKPFLKESVLKLYAES